MLRHQLNVRNAVQEALEKNRKPDGEPVPLSDIVHHMTRVRTFGLVDRAEFAGFVRTQFPSAKIDYKA